MARQYPWPYLLISTEDFGFYLSGTSVLVLRSSSFCHESFSAARFLTRNGILILRFDALGNAQGVSGEVMPDRKKRAKTGCLSCRQRRVKILAMLFSYHPTASSPSMPMLPLHVQYSAVTWLVRTGCYPQSALKKASSMLLELLGMLTRSCA